MIKNKNILASWNISNRQLDFLQNEHIGLHIPTVCCEHGHQCFIIQLS